MFSGGIESDQRLEMGKQQAIAIIKFVMRSKVVSFWNYEKTFFFFVVNFLYKMNSFCLYEIKYARKFQQRRERNQFFLFDYTTNFRGVTRTPVNIQDGELCSNSQRLKAINYCCKALHPRCLRGPGCTSELIVFNVLGKFLLSYSRM